MFNPRVFFLFVVAGFFQACGDNPTVCTDSTLLTEDQLAGTKPIGRAIEELTARNSSLWPGQEISVCFEPAPPEVLADPAKLEVRAECIRQFEGWVDQTWGEALRPSNVPEENHIRIAYRSSDCEPNTNGIHVQTNPLENGIDFRNGPDDVNPSGYTIGMGTELDGVENGMVIYQCYAPVVIHEFGHALGFGHEQARRDDNATCALALEFPDQSADQMAGNIYLGISDAASIMHYCADDGTIFRDTISEGDQEGTRAVYYPESSNYVCREFSDEDFAGAQEELQTETPDVGQQIESLLQREGLNQNTMSRSISF